MQNLTKNFAKKVVLKDFSMYNGEVELYDKGEKC